MSKRAWVTLATNDSYALGALVLAHSLRRVGSVYPAVVLITPSVTENMRGRLSAVFGEVVTVDVLDSRDAAHLALLARPELGVTFTKIHCWSLTQYEKCVFLDADTLVVQNSDELFEREELSAAPDVGWPDCFNSGVFVFAPSEATFNSLLEFAKERGSFDGGDQGLLNSYFSSWAHGDINKHLPFLYNVTSVAFYSYLPALKEFGQGVKIIHFIGNAKPWLQNFNWETRTVSGEGHVQPTLQLWWDIFVDNVHSHLDETMTGLAGTLSRLTLGPTSSQQAALDEHTRRQGWEAGNIDYLGADSFANIWAKISSTLAQPPAPAKAEESKPAEGEVATLPIESEIQQKSEQSSTPSVDTQSVPETAPSSDSQPAEPTASVEAVSESAVPVSSQPEPASEKEAAPASEPVSEAAPATSPESVPKPPATPVASNPTSEAPQPAAETVQSTEAQQVESVPKPAEPEPTTEAKPVEPEPAQPVEPAATPAEPTAAPVETPAETAQTAEPAQPTPEPTPTPAEPTQTPAKLAQPSAEPAPIAAEPAQATAEPAPVDPAPAPVAEVPSSDAPVDVAAAPQQTPETTAETPKVESDNTVASPAAPTTPAVESPVTPPEPEKPATPPSVEVAPPQTPGEAPVTPLEATPEKSAPEQASTDSPPLISTPVKDSVSPKSAEEISGNQAAPKTETRKVPAIEKLNCQLKPSQVETTLLTPDSELEDAATLAQKIIASEMGIPLTPLVISATPPVITSTPILSRNEKQLSVDEPELTTPPVSLAQIGITPKTTPEESTEQAKSEAKENIPDSNQELAKKETTETKEDPNKKEKSHKSTQKDTKSDKGEQTQKPQADISKKTEPALSPDDKKKDVADPSEQKTASTPSSPVEKSESTVAAVAPSSEAKLPQESIPKTSSEPQAPEPRKKKVVKKVVKKEESSEKGSSESAPAASAPVPPPRKKEKKPTEKK